MARNTEHGDEEWHCWEWTGRIGDDGYGRIKIYGKHYRAHRIAYRLATMTPLEPEVIMHVCDNPRCVNPLHLVGGTPTENAADMTRKGRRRKEGRRAWKLTPTDILEIEKSSLLQREVAQQYGVCQSYISRIRRRAT